MIPLLCLAVVCTAFPLNIATTRINRFGFNRRDFTSWSHAKDDEFRAWEGNNAWQVSRRSLFASSGLAIGAFLPAGPVAASVPEIDMFGNLFTPKTDMNAGGSIAARGGVAPERRKTSQLGPSIYETRFVAYLSRFLLNFEPSARAYWTQQGYGFSWSMDSAQINKVGEGTEMQAAFAAFADSVEVGLADYFSGPFGSYSSITAALAGLSAAQPAKSQPADKKNKDKRKQGILNLYSLLKARFNSISAKRQLAILFSFISDPALQPTSEIRQLLGETDNATITEIRLTGSFRSRGGFSRDDLPIISVEDPPPLGDKYRRATVLPIMKPTTRILRIDVIDGGEGYALAPAVSVYSSRPVQRLCQATAILDRFGSVKSIIVLDPGLGYYDSKKKPPRVKIESPTGRGGRRARAVVALELEVVGVTVEDGGNGFVSTEQPTVSITSPRQDPDWFVDVMSAPTMRMVRKEPVALGAEVTEMRYADGNLAFSSTGTPNRSFSLTDEFIDLISRDPLELLPSAVRPELVEKNGKSLYTILPLATVPQYVAFLAPRYRAYDPVFGGVGRLPVTKGAAALTASEYARLALSGAVCTVLVRTLLNPLELIKTKQQLDNDDELLQFARGGTLVPDVSKIDKNPAEVVSGPSPSAPITDYHPNIEESLSGERITTVMKETESILEPSVETRLDSQPVGTAEMIQAMVKLRGPSSLFQSLDITFLASIPFGSLGFGATELFRRSFTDFFAGGEGSEIPLLLAASAATVITAAAVSPFEVLRVRSMGSLESKPWTEILDDFLQENSKTPDLWKKSQYRYQELLSLWTGFAPILSRELPFAIAKFLTFDFIAISTVNFLNSRSGEDSLPVQIGVGGTGLLVSALAGAIAGVAGAFVSHPADLILTKTSALPSQNASKGTGPAWILVVRDLVSREGGVANLFVGLSSRSLFFFLVIGLQFFLYDYVKNLFRVGSDDLSLVLDVFYSVRAGLGMI